MPKPETVKQFLECQFFGVRSKDFEERFYMVVYMVVYLIGCPLVYEG